MIYLDTNVILARYAPGERCYEYAKTLIKAIETGEYKGATSVFTLVEAASVVSRAYTKFLEAEKRMSQDELIGAYLKKISGLQLEFIPLGEEVVYKIDKAEIKLPLLFEISLLIASKTSAKSLDNIHIASAYKISMIERRALRYFITEDEDLLKKKRDISSVIDSPIVSLEEFMRVEGLVK